MTVAKDITFKFRVKIDYDAICPNGDFEGSSKTYKVDASDAYSAVEQALEQLKERIKSQVGTDAKLVGVKIECNTVKQADEVYELITGDKT
jgi:hypothetical protein